MANLLLNQDDLTEFYPFCGDLSICTPVEDHQKKVVSQHLKIQQSNLKVIFSNNLNTQDVKRLNKKVTLGVEFQEKLYKATVGENIKAALYELKRDAKAPDFDDVPDPVDDFSPTFNANY